METEERSCGHTRLCLGGRETPRFVNLDIAVRLRVRYSTVPYCTGATTGLVSISKTPKVPAPASFWRITAAVPCFHNGMVQGYTDS